MKKAPVLILLVVGIGAAAFSSPFSGDVSVSATFDDSGVMLFDAVIDVGYTISGIVLGAKVIFGLDAFRLLIFTADGPLGPIDFDTYVAFVPGTGSWLPVQSPTFVSWSSMAKLELGGLSIFGASSLSIASYLPVTYGFGAAVGVFGSMGDVGITAAMYFNMYDYTEYLYWYGYDWLVSQMVFQLCDEWFFWATVNRPECYLCWDGATIIVDFPLSCLDVTAWLSIRCPSCGELEEGGIGYLALVINGIETGLSWLGVDELWISFTPDSKFVWLYWDVVLGDLVCATPYFSLEGESPNFWSIDGITLNALLLEYDYNGVTVKAGEIFDDTWYPGVLGGGVTNEWGFTLEGGLTTRSFRDRRVPDDGCVYDLDYDEFFGIWIDGDSCCGGGFDVGLINFFDTVPNENHSASYGLHPTDFVEPYPAIFDWAETVATIEVGIGTNVSIALSFSVYDDGLNWFKITANFSS